jgi:hypothetical protein
VQAFREHVEKEGGGATPEVEGAVDVGRRAVAEPEEPGIAGGDRDMEERILKVRLPDHTGLRSSADRVEEAVEVLVHQWDG